METILNIGDAAQNAQIPGATAGVTAQQGFAGLIGTIMGAVMIIALLLLLFYLVWGAIDWITAAGDKGKLEAARGKMVNAAIGVIILSSVTAIFVLVQYFLGLNVIQFNLGTAGGGGNAAAAQCFNGSTSCPGSHPTEENRSQCGAGCGAGSVCCR